MPCASTNPSCIGYTFALLAVLRTARRTRRCACAGAANATKRATRNMHDRNLAFIMFPSFCDVRPRIAARSALPPPQLVAKNFVIGLLLRPHQLYVVRRFGNCDAIAALQFKSHLP